MKDVKHFILMLALGAVSLFMWNIACSPTQPGQENTSEKSTQTDGGTNKDANTADTAGKDTSPPMDTTPKDDTPSGPIEITFDPASGEIEIDACVNVKFSRAPSKLTKAGFTADGASSPTAAIFKFDPKDKDKKTALACPLSYLTQGTKYTLDVEVKDKGTDGKLFTGKATYTTKSTYTKDKPADAGLAVNMLIKSITTPELLGNLLASAKDQIPPILLTLHQRDEGSKGNLVLVGGLGMAPPGGKPHEGKDVVNTETPVSLSLKGRFDGRWFAVGPTTFVLSVAGVTVQLEDFNLTGVFSADGKNIEKAKLSGVIDPDAVKDRFSMDICAVVECDVGPDGKKRVRVAGDLEGIPNPIGYAAFITNPLYLQSSVDPATKIEFYATEDTKQEDITVALSTCTGSQKPEEKPCSTKDGATVTKVEDKGTTTVDASKKHGEYAPTKLNAATWYKLELTAKNGSGKEFKTFVEFKTK